jgi:hypothetical protein
MLIILLFFTESENPIVFGYSLRLSVLIIFFATATAGLLYLVLRSGNRSNQNACLLLLSLFFCFLFSEAALRFFERDPHQRYEKLKEMRQEGERVYPTINPIHSKLNRLTPLGNALSLLGNEGYGWITYHSDENGFRNPMGLYSASQSFDIFAVGDSFTLSYAVPEDNDWLNQLRRRYNAYNAGLPGASPLQELAILLEYGLQKNPKIVLWVYYENDFQDFPRELENPFLKSRMPQSIKRYFICETKGNPGNVMGDDLFRQWLDQKIESRIQAGQFGEEWKKKPIIQYLQNEIRLLNRLVEMTNPSESSFQETLRRTVEYGPLFRDILHVAKSELNRTGGSILFIYLPSVGHWLPQSRDILSQIERRTLDAVREVGIQILNFKKKLDKAPDVFAMYSSGKQGGHFSLKGYGLLAQAVEEHIRIHMGWENHIIPVTQDAGYSNGEK